ncbi:MAG TPA: hypothetical protein VET23_01235 [Chitinophagaceae bacterium]|nr:hypothetical protein [Chitinophagaceae bacterium]
MFKSLKFLWLLPFCFILYACPFESPLPLDEKPVAAVDTSLLGYWYGIVKDGSDFFGVEALDISRHSDSTYDIIRYGKVIKGDMILPDTSHFIGYTSKLGDQLYMNIEATIVEVIPRRKKEPEIKTTKVYYLATLKLRHDTLSIKTVTDGFAGLNPNFRNPEDLRKAITSLQEKGKNVYDDTYKLSYRKMERPQQQKPSE